MFEVFFDLDIISLQFPKVRVKAVGNNILLLVTLILRLMLYRLIANFFIFLLLSWLNVKASLIFFDFVGNLVWNRFNFITKLSLKILLPCNNFIRKVLNLQLEVELQLGDRL
jgi:hypothetical protein